MRKRTTPVHIAGGVFVGYILWLNPAVGITLILAFGLFEVWEKHEEGVHDFWEFLLGLFIGAVLGLIQLIICSNSPQPIINFLRSGYEAQGSYKLFLDLYCIRLGSTYPIRQQPAPGCAVMGYY